MTTPLGPYTPLVEAGGWLICSGQLGLADGELVQGVAGQTMQALRNAESLLSGHGGRLTDVVKTLVFLVDMGAYEEMNTAYVAAFGDHRPARSAVGVTALPKGALVEIELWARRPAE